MLFVIRTSDSDATSFSLFGGSLSAVNLDGAEETGGLPLGISKVDERPAISGVMDEDMGKVSRRNAPVFGCIDIVAKLQ
jgi:hypothetical protein